MKKKIAGLGIIFLGLLLLFGDDVVRESKTIEQVKSGLFMDDDTEDVIFQKTKTKYEVVKEKTAVNPNYEFSVRNTKLFISHKAPVKKEPFAMSETVKYLDIGDELFSYGYNEFNGFYKIKIDGNEYYVHGKYLSESQGDVFVPFEATVYAAEQNKVYRSLFDERCEELGVNTELTVIAQNDEYFKISFPFEGYILKVNTMEKPMYYYDKFAKYNLSDEECLKLARVAYNEQGSLKGAAAEASLMCNLYEYQGLSYGSVYNYVRDSGWFSRSESVMDYGSCPDSVVKIVTAVIREGKRTIPGYVNDHDCFNNIISAKNDGVEIEIRDRSAYVSCKTIISNRYTGTWTFWGFVTDTSDPFGYKSEEWRMRLGEDHYDFDMLAEELGLQ